MRILALTSFSPTSILDTLMKSTLPFQNCFSWYLQKRKTLRRRWLSCPSNPKWASFLKKFFLEEIKSRGKSHIINIIDSLIIQEAQFQSICSSELSIAWMKGWWKNGNQLNSSWFSRFCYTEFLSFSNASSLQLLSLSRESLFQ